MRTPGRYTLSVFLLLAILAGCDLTPQPKRAQPTAKPPKQQEAPALRVPDAAMSDTGAWEEGASLIRSITYLPTAPTAFDDIEVVVQVEKLPGMDVDYEWVVNGKKLISARSKVLRQISFNKGDEVRAIITVEKDGRSATKDGGVVVVGNAPPRILTNPSTLRKLDGFRVRADDPDGTAISYRMQSAPPGLTIGEYTGVFRYAPSKSAEGGKYKITVIASDEDGGESEWSLEVTISGGSDSKEGKARRAKAKAEWEAKRKAKMKRKAGQ